MNWDKSYEDNRDYYWMPTQSLSHLVNLIGIKPTLTDAYKLLDIGCGTGQLARDMYHKGFDVTGIDTSEAAVTIAKESTVKADGISFLRHDITRNPLDDIFTVITCKYVFAFIEDRDAFLKNVVKSLCNTNQAAFVVITPNPEHLPDAKKHIAIDPLEARQILKQYFELVYEEMVGGDIWYIAKRPLLR